MTRRLLVPFLAGTLFLVPAAPLRGAQPPSDDAERAVREALARTKNVAEQEEVLVQMAWLRPDLAPDVAERARLELELFGAASIPAMRRALSRVPKESTASVVGTILAARESQVAGIPLDYFPALVDALWIGTPEAKRLAIPRVAAQGEKAAVLPLIDSALDDPSLTPDVIRALGVIGDDRGRFFLEKVLRSGATGDREAAAVSLARIGGRAMAPLRDALRSEDRDVRLAAARAILPVATPDDLTAFYVYLSEHEDDDPATAQAIRSAAAIIEEKREAQQAAGAASAPKDF